MEQCTDSMNCLYPKEYQSTVFDNFFISRGLANQKEKTYYKEKKKTIDV